MKQLIKKLPNIKEIISKKINSRWFNNFFYINLGLVIMSIPFVFFLDPNNLVTGGVSAIAIVMKNLLGDPEWLSTAYLILGLNFVLLIVGFFFLSNSFMIKTIYGSLVYPLYIYLLELVYQLIVDKTDLLDGFYQGTNWLVLLIVSAILLGIGLGLVLRSDASTGGVDIIQAILLKYFHLPFSVGLVLIDGLVVVLGSLLIGYNNDANVLINIMHGCLFIIICGQVIDSIVFRGFNSKAVHIISKDYGQVKRLIYDLFERGVTEVYARGGFSQKDIIMLICIMNSREFNIFRSKLKDIDKSSFMYVTKAAEVHGEGFSFFPVVEDQNG